jgi:hypothetical protein
MGAALGPSHLLSFEKSLTQNLVGVIYFAEVGSPRTRGDGPYPWTPHKPRDLFSAHAWTLSDIGQYIDLSPTSAFLTRLKIGS